MDFGPLCAVVCPEARVAPRKKERKKKWPTADITFFFTEQASRLGLASRDHASLFHRGGASVWEKKDPVNVNTGSRRGLYSPAARRLV